MFDNLVSPNYAGAESARLTAGQERADAEERLAEICLQGFLEDDAPEQVAELVNDPYEVIAKLIKAYRANVEVPDGDAINAEIEIILRDALKGEAKAIAEDAVEDW